MSILDEKSLRICNVLGGLDVVRYVSSNTRQVFEGAIEDVELIREYLSEAMLNSGIVGGFSNFEALSLSLSWKARGLPNINTTIGVGLGIVDDRMDRRVDRYVGTKRDQPFVGNKETDMKIVDTLSNLLPWIVDRRSSEKFWMKSHQNGRSEGKNKRKFPFDSLYTAAWIGSYGNAWLYYPPMTVFSNDHPLTMGDIAGDDLESHNLPFVQPNLPKFNQDRTAFLRNPYPDSARPGLSLITAMAPVYFTGSFGNYTFNDTYIASTGVDIAVKATSSLLDVLLDRMTENSFAIVVDMNFHTIIISQAVVEKIYPPRTGFEASRVTYDALDGSIIEDRRNQTYLVSDTIHQDLTQLKNADWNGLLKEVTTANSGERRFTAFNITLSGMMEALEFQVMYERWPDVADWVLMAFAPTEKLKNSIQVGIYNSASSGNKSSIHISGEWGKQLFGELILVNHGYLDITLTTKSAASWIDLVPHDLVKYSIPSKNNLTLQFRVDTSKLTIGVSSFLLTFSIEDDDYPDCFYSGDISLPVTIQVQPRDCATLTGDSMRVSDLNGNCRCSLNTLELGGTCYRILLLFFMVLIPLVITILLSAHYYIEIKRKQDDSIWRIELSDLNFDDPPVVLGRGTFGLVLLAEYRGTKVAVKRVIPSSSMNTDTSLERFNSNYISGHKMVNFLFDFRSDIENDISRESDPLLQLPSTKMNDIPSSKIKSTINGLKDVLKSSSSPSDTMLHAKLKEDFILEMRLLSKLRHPCITTVMGAVIATGEEPLLVMELMQHGSLFDLLHNETMIVEGDIILQILRDISQGLRFLHAATPEVIHGDLKAQNVLVDSNFRAKVADFGLSQKKDVGFVGTPYWMAPELLMGKSSQNPSTDVYSFGIILYEVYSRKIPYDGEDFNLTIGEICDPSKNKRPPAPQSMPSEVIALMTACTQACSKLRPSFKEINTKLNTFSVENVEPGPMMFSMQTSKLLNLNPTNSQNLLLEIFPKDVAEALSQGQKVEPKHFDCVTIFFSDIVGFTTIAHDLSPWKISDMLDRLYNKFDSLSRKHQVFKVETIGDAWMGVTNLERPQPDHTKRIANFAVDAIRAASITLIDQEDVSRGFINIRVGFHSGPVIGNVVGSRNPKFTLIGDTVNTSSRMESNSRKGCILCSSISAKLLSEQSEDFSIQSRGMIEVKGKGLMETFWIERKNQNNGKVSRDGKLKKQSKRFDCAHLNTFLAHSASGLEEDES
jgi:serine/threonine protein kinase